MRVIWIDSRYHNPKIIGTAWIQVGIEDQGDYRTKKVETASFAMNEIRVFHDTKCVLQCVQNGRMGNNSYQGVETNTVYDWVYKKVE